MTGSFARLSSVTLLLATVACSGQPDSRRPTQAVAAGAGESLSGCQPHIEIHDSAFWAKELGQTEALVLQNHRINLWERPGADRGKKTGELLVGSRAIVLQEADGAFRVKSPLDGSTGWISDIQVARTLKQDVSTRQPC